MGTAVSSKYGGSLIEANNQSEQMIDESNNENIHKSEQIDEESKIENVPQSSERDSSTYSEVDHGKKELKLVLVGNTTMGKTCLIKQYLYSQYSELYEPSVLDVFKGTKNIDGHTVEVEIHDTSGDEHLGTNRKV